MQETWVQFQGQEYHLEKEWQSTTVFLTRKSHGQRNWTSYSLWSCKRVQYDLATQQLGDSSKNIATIYLKDFSSHLFF